MTEMEKDTSRIIIAGGRDFNDYELLSLAVNQVIDYIKPVKVEIISGACRGTDKLGERYAAINGYEVRRFYPDWNKYGKAAGPIRNKQMAEYAAEYSNGYLVAFWDGSSKGTKNMIENARFHRLKIQVVNY